jgi:hypothetical protein
MTKNELIKKIKLAAAIYISEIRKINIFSNLIFYKLIMNLFININLEKIIKK